MAPDPAKPGGYSFANSGLAARVFQSNAVGLVIGESQRIDRYKLAVQFAESPFIGQ